MYASSVLRLKVARALADLIEQAGARRERSRCDLSVNNDLPAQGLAGRLARQAFDDSGARLSSTFISQRPIGRFASFEVQVIGT
jgi:hypothetical protein